MQHTADRSIPVRRVSFEESLRDLDKHFADGDLVTSHILASLSSVFPDGEEYFVRSVRYYRDQITDPELKQEINGFIGQEVVHGREHRVFNDKLDALGYPTKKLEALTKKGLAMQEKRMTPEENLAVTAALEHFTATMGELLLSNDELSGMIGHEQVRQMFLWHALEETEHKAVAFDVYRAVGGSEKTRKRVMNRVTFDFLFGMTLQTVVAVLFDRATYKRGRLIPSLKRVAKSPMFTKEMWRKLRDYNRDGFHPNDHDTTELLARKRAEFFGAGGRIADKLPAAA